MVTSYQVADSMGSGRRVECQSGRWRWRTANGARAGADVGPKAERLNNGKPWGISGITPW